MALLKEREFLTYLPQPQVIEAVASLYGAPSSRFVDDENNPGTPTLQTTVRLQVDDMPLEDLRRLSVAALGEIPFTLWISRLGIETEAQVKVPTLKFVDGRLRACFTVVLNGLDLGEIQRLSAPLGEVSLTLRPRLG